MVFQIICGFLYAAAGVLFAIFMSGLAMGAWHEPENPLSSFSKKPLKIQFMLTLLSALIPVVLFFLIKIDNILLTYLALFMIIFVLAYTAGRQFYYSQRIFRMEQVNKTGYVYGSDLLGSALGLIVVSTVLLPIFGFVVSAFVLLIINILALILIKVFRDNG